MGVFAPICSKCSVFLKKSEHYIAATYFRKVCQIVSKSAYQIMRYIDILLNVRLFGFFRLFKATLLGLAIDRTMPNVRFLILPFTPPLKCYPLNLQNKT